MSPASRSGVWTAVALVLASTTRVLGSGGTVRPATSGMVDYVAVLQVPSGSNDRFITRYGFPGIASPNGSEFLCPNTIICGARTRSGHQSVAASRPELVDVRLEDPNNPGFPDVLPAPTVPGSALTLATPAVGADSNASPSQCPTQIGYQSYTFNSGAGIPDPLSAIFLSWQITPAASMNPCYLAIEVFAPVNGRASTFDSNPGTYSAATWNQWLEVVALCPAPTTLSLRMHGSEPFTGDHGLVDWFARADEAGTIVDDFVSATLVVDNALAVPSRPQTLQLVVDPSAIRPGMPRRNVASAFQLAGVPGTTLATGNPYSWAPGRTILRGSVSARVRAGVRRALPANLPFFASTVTTTGGVSLSPTSVLGARRQRGQIDDGSAEIGVLSLRRPVVTGDALAQRFPERRFFPTIAGRAAARVDITRIDLGVVGIGTSPGFDAVQIRRDDPVLLNTADMSPSGLYGSIGSVGDGLAAVGVPVDPNGACVFVSASPATAIRVPNVSDVWALVSFMPGGPIAGASGSALCADLTPATVLGDAFTTLAGAQPFEPAPDRNWMIRLVSLPHAFSGVPPFDPPAMRETRRVPLRVGNEIPKRVGR